MSRILELFAETRWAMDQRVLVQMRDVLVRHASGDRLTDDQVAEIVAAGDQGQRITDELPEDPRVAVIPVQGVIARYSSQVGGLSKPRGTSVEQIRARLQAALDDDGVETIVFAVNSPGGSAQGVAELADDIRAARGRKPMIAQVDGLMASAAYWIGAQADEIRATRGSEIGSIGVYAVVDDMRAWYREHGIDTRVVRSSPLKGVGVQGASIDEAHLAEIQRGVQATYEMFVEAVADGRRLDIDTARELADGRVHMAPAALQMGLIDRVATLPETWGELTSSFAGGSRPRAASREGDMTTKQSGHTSNPAPQAQGDAASTSAAVFDIAAELDRARTEGRAAGLEEGRRAAADAARAAGAADERLRCARIVRAATPSQSALAARLVADGVDLDAALVQLADDPRRHAHAALAARVDAAPAAIDGAAPTAGGAPAKPQDPEAAARAAFDSDPDKDAYESFEAWQAFQVGVKAGHIRGKRS